MSSVVVNIRYESYDILIDRTTIWGNPYKLNHIITKDEAIILDNLDLENKMVDRNSCIMLFEHYLRNNEYLLSRIMELNNKKLGCWCKPKLCHGDIYLKILDEIKNNELFEY